MLLFPTTLQARAELREVTSDENGKKLNEVGRYGQCAHCSVSAKKTVPFKYENGKKLNEVGR